MEDPYYKKYIKYKTKYSKIKEQDGGEIEKMTTDEIENLKSIITTVYAIKVGGPPIGLSYESIHRTIYNLRKKDKIFSTFINILFSLRFPDGFISDKPSRDVIMRTFRDISLPLRRETPTSGFFLEKCFDVVFTDPSDFDSK
jgi:hypothetical protein